MLSADNQQGRTRNLLNPWYITGFVEGEGTFHIALYKDSRMKQLIKVIPEFHINQSYLRIDTLKEIQNYFGCGYLKENHAKNINDTTYVYVVRNREDLLRKIIPFFRRYSLHSVKRNSFDIFATVVEQMAEGRHKTKNGLLHLIDLAYQMNLDGKYRSRKKEDLLKSL